MEHQIVPPSSHSQQGSASESSTTATRPIHSRSASHPIKTAFLTARKAIHYQLSNPNLATPQSTTSDHPSMLLPALNPLNADSMQKTSDPLRFKSTLFSSPSNPEISVGHISRRLLEPIRPLQTPHRETGQLEAIPTSLAHNIPTRPTRSNVAHNELMVRGPFPVIVSSVAHPSSTKKRSHRRRWTTQRSKDDNPLNSNDSEPFNLSLLNQQAVVSSENGRSTLVADQHSDDASNNISPQSPQTSDHSDTDCNQLTAPYPIGNLDYNDQESFDIEDLTTPTLKSCERFEDDNSITPCQTFTTPSFKKLQQGLKVTPRMIYEDYQKKFNEEDLMIKSRDLKVSPRHENPHLTIGKNNFDNDYGNAAHVIVSDDSTASAAPHGTSLDETSLQDAADESFESFGDDQFFGPLFSSKSRTTRKRNSELIGVFPLPPATRNLSCLPSNVQRTPSPKQMAVPGSSKASTPVIPRIVMVGNEKEPARSRTSSPLVLGKPLRANASTNQCTGKNTPFQLQPSPYRHVEHDSIFHDGPDHLESSTRLMNMFDSFLERSPKGSGSNGSARSSLSKKSYRNLKFEESPLKKFSSFHLPETPELIMPLQHAVIRDSLGLYAHSTPFNVAHSQRSSGLAFQISKNSNVDTDACLAATDSSSISARLPKLGSLLSPQECYTSLSADSSNNFSSRRDEHPSPASDSDDEPSPTPKTPFGNVFTPSNQLEPFVPTFGPLSVQSLSQKLVFKTDTHSPLEFQPLSLEDGSLHRLPKLSHSTKPKENATNDPFYEPQLKNRKSMARLMADGLLRLTNKRIAKEPFNLSDFNGKLKKDLNQRDQSSSPTDEGFDSSPNQSNWKSIIGQDVDLPTSKFSMNLVNAGRQNASNGKPISGRILFEELNRDFQDFIIIDTQQPTGSSKAILNFSLKEVTNARPSSKIAGPSTYDICTPSPSGNAKYLTHTSSSSLDGFGKKFEQQSETLTEGTEDVPKDLQQILSPIRLYGKQQGVLETGNWKTNNLNFQSMKSQYQVSTFKSDDRPTEVKSRDAGAAMSRDNTLTEETHKKKAGRLQEEEEEAEKEKNESLMVYKIQEEDENQIINFELNRLKKIFYNKALKSSKSKSKLSSESKPRVKLFNH
ncbi:hypothetical protein PGT21_003184 [Puccinia graminis f. sp. tritici]|uniref:Uncharacterized protein n=1 Tax=Puccinia graminis f. sp. tritici TaxID=56615 RepID=A0A5B0Q506_PUCGR|nr:hypothetical protein PGT21_003184 [Puccinia graminis f. sp. tritici]